MTDADQVNLPSNAALQANNALSAENVGLEQIIAVSAEQSVQLLDKERLDVLLDSLQPARPDPLQLKADIEAALFVTGKALQLEEIAEIVEASVDDVEMALGELIQDVAFREGSGLEIDDTDGYILQVREECSRIVHKMMPLELSSASVRTLSAIAIKAPILQSDLIELRGSSAYDHIGELLVHKLISKRRQGRSYVLNTTKAFYDYFKLNGDKRELESLVNRLKPETKTKAAEANSSSTDHPSSTLQPSVETDSLDSDLAGFEESSPDQAEDQALSA